MDVIPDAKYRGALENYSPKFDIQMLELLCKRAGLKTADERIYKMMSVLLEDKMVKILDEVGAMQA